MGMPETLVCDQGREFLSAEFETWCLNRNVYVYFIGIQSPWQNGLAERSGATLKAMIAAVVRGHTCVGAEEMSGEATAAYNSDVNEEGVSPRQAVTGRQQAPPGDQ